VRAASERELRIPDDFRLAAAVDSHQARDADVTAIDLRPHAQGEAAVGLLLDRLAGKRRDAPLITPSALRVRNSTGTGPSRKLGPEPLGERAVTP
jgi:DNA-binding LacI/PurR family transcriptional regulator